MNLLPDSLLRLVFGYANISIKNRLTSSTTFGDLSWYSGIMRYTRITYIDQRIISKLCEIGNLQLIKQICDKFNLTREEFLKFDFDEMRNRMLYSELNELNAAVEISPLFIICKFNRLDIFKWIMEKFSITREEIGIKDGILFTWIAGHCDSTFMNYFLSLYMPSVDRLLYGFMEICRTGNLENCKQIIKMCPKDSIIADSIHIRLTDACVNGHLSLAKFITEELSLDKYFEHEEINQIFMEICRIGKLKIIKWFMKKFDILSKYTTLLSTYHTRIRRSGNVKVTIYFENLLVLKNVPP